jgi:hypothetical protein
LLPCNEDGDFHTYHRRVSAELSKPYGLIITDWHRFCRTSWETICASLAGLTNQVGVSASRMDTQLFLGTYERTAFGVHIDDAGGFHFPLIGKKKLRFWSSEYVSSEPNLKHSHNYDNFLEASHSIEADPGEMIYWPSHYWHIGEGDGSFNLTWRFGYWIADGLLRRALTEFSKMPDEGDIEHRSALPQQATGEKLKAFAWSVIHDLQGRAESTEFRDRVIAATLELQSAFGFTRVPQPKIPEDRNGPFGLKFPFRIEHAAVTSDKRLIALAGKSCRLLDSVRLKQLIDALNGGSFIEAPDQNATRESVDIQRFLEFMQESGAVQWERGDRPKSLEL